jgi:hypothetical protein
MIEKIRELIRPLGSSNEASWLGHGLQGFVFGLALYPLFGVESLLFTIGAFLHREVDNLLEFGWKHFIEDGLADFFAPYGAHVLAIVLIEGLTLLLG